MSLDLADLTHDTVRNRLVRLPPSLQFHSFFYLISLKYILVLHSYAGLNALHKTDVYFLGNSVIFNYFLLRLFKTPSLMQISTL